MSEVIVVIGAGSIGQAIARRVSAGKHVVLADLHDENADAAAEVMRDAGFAVSTHLRKDDTLSRRAANFASSSATLTGAAGGEERSSPSAPLTLRGSGHTMGPPHPAAQERNVSIYDHHLEKTPANHVPLTPVSFVERSAEVFGDLPAVIHGTRRYSWAQTCERSARLAAG